MVEGEPSRVLQGTHQHAAYIIEVPPNWNGELVRYTHGYRGNTKVLTVSQPGSLRQRLLDQGYVWAASSYARNEYDPGSGVVTTHGQSLLAGKLLGQRPERTYIVGASMGGHVIGRSLEEYPMHYVGALPMCGAVAGQELMDYYLDVNLVAQALAGRPAFPYPDDYHTVDVPIIQKALGLTDLTPTGPDTTNDLGKQYRSITTKVTGGERPRADEAFAYWKDFRFELVAADTGGTLAANDGRVAENMDTIYAPNSPVDVNSIVARTEPADRSASKSHRLGAIPRVKGRPHVPVLSLSNIGDHYVPLSMEQVYRRNVEKHNQSHLLVQRAIRAAGHCEFTPTEVGTAWDDLTRWVESRGPGRKYRDVARPSGDDVLTPAVVASPSFGCQFTDPTAYSSPNASPTRAFYDRCPD